MSIAAQSETMEQDPEALVTGRDEQVAPEHGRTAGGDGKSENGVDTHYRGQIGEAEREVRPQAHRAIKVGVIAEGFELSGVSLSCGWLGCHRDPFRLGPQNSGVGLAILR